MSGIPKAQNKMVKVIGRMKAQGSERGHDLRDEVDLMMRLRIPWRERMGGRVNAKGKRRAGQTEMEVQRKKKGKVTKKVEKVLEM